MSTIAMRIAIYMFVCGLFAVQLYTGPAFAHAAEQGFVLLLPTDIYISAGMAAFILTVVLIALMPGRISTGLFTSWGLLPKELPEPLKAITSLISATALAGLVFIGITGSRDPLSNLLSLFIWSAWWNGFVMLHMAVGNLWSWINPWTGLNALAFKEGSPPLLPFPSGLGRWPAIVLFCLFSSFTIADPAPADPDRLAQMVLIYWLFTFAGMALFGAGSWARHCECFTVFFQLLSAISPLRIGRQIRVGFPGWALFTNVTPSFTLALFCLILLGSGSFDGLNETFWWLDLIGVNPLDYPGRSALIVQTILGYVGSNLLLISLFALCAWLGCRLAGPGEGPGVQTVFQTLALSVVPIALGFHVAHFLTTFLIWGQYTLAALTDPFASGANYLGFSDTRVYMGFLRDAESVRWIWLIQATIIVLAHVFAVLIANAMTRRLFKTRRAALWAELPFSLFMIGYTFFGLWLLAAPRGA